MVITLTVLQVFERGRITVRVVFYNFVFGSRTVGRSVRSEIHEFRNAERIANFACVACSVLIVAIIVFKAIEQQRQTI
jgi:hypothetical protein